MIFTEGLKAIYKDRVGVVRCVTDHYLTFCIDTFPNERSRDVCILIYPSDYKKIKLIDV